LVVTRRKDKIVQEYYNYGFAAIVGQSVEIPPFVSLRVGFSVPDISLNAGGKCEWF